MRYHTTILVLIVFHFAAYPRLLSAESKTIIVQPHDSLSSIVSTHYPAGIPTNSVMRAIVARNPEAFINNNIHRLVSGKQLVLPEFEGISPTRQTLPVDTTPTAPSSLQTSLIPSNEQPTRNLSLNERISDLEALRLKLTAQIEQLETDNQSLQTQVTRYEIEKKEKEEKIKALNDQVTQLENTINNNSVEENSQSSDFEAANQSLQQQLTRIKQTLDDKIKENDTLNEKLMRLNNEQSLHVSSTSTYNWLWGLGLLGLLLTLLWLFLKPYKTTKKIALQTAAFMPPTHASSLAPLPISETNTTKPNPQNASYIKLNIAYAYMDMRMPEAAVDLLEEVLREGNLQQKQQAQEILSTIT